MFHTCGLIYSKFAHGKTAQNIISYSPRAEINQNENWLLLQDLCFHLEC